MKREDLLIFLIARAAGLRTSLAQLSGQLTNCAACGQPLPNAQAVEKRRILLQQDLATVQAQAAPLAHRAQLWKEYDQQAVKVSIWEAERDRIQDALDALKACDPPSRPRNELLDVVSTYDALARDINQLANARREMIADRARIQQQLDEFRQIRERAVRTRAAVTALTEIRQVFHHDEAPRMVSYTFIERMLEEINDTLEIFSAPFRVVMDEDLGFIANFLDGVRHQPDRRLSVGERITLALAFRITVNSTFAGQIGLLVLDEPTAGLDEYNLGCLPAAFARLKELSEQRGLQVLLVTHEPRITSLFDNVITLPAAQT